MGGSQSQEFMCYTDAGEDLIASCDMAGCEYAANVEKATSRLEPIVELEPTADGKPERVHTPSKGDIADVSEFLHISPNQDIKCVAYMAGFHISHRTARIPVIAFLRGDHTLNEVKLNALVGAVELNLMTSEDIEKTFHAPAGYLGPIGLNALDAENFAFLQQHGMLPESVAGDEHNPPRDYAGTNVRWYYKRPVVILDKALEGRQSMVCGANKLDYHLRNVTPGRDFKWTLSADIRSVNAGEGCPRRYHPLPGSENKVVYPFRPDGYCSGTLLVGKAVEIGHIFKLGYKYSESMGARVLDVNGKEVTLIMGSYGIGIERILTAAIEQSNDKNGFWLPASIAPFTVVVTVTNVSDAALAEAGEKLAAELEAAGLDVLLDDRDERAGVKFKDADLVGIPYRINVGKKAAGGFVELVRRATSTSVDVELQNVVAAVKARVEEDALLTVIEA
jgi:prolyl-tRNA synthetase